MAMPSAEPRPAKRRLGARSIMVIVVGLLLGGLVVPPWINVSRYRTRIAESISRSLGRPVTIGSISLRLLPQPGFDLSNLAVGDDPAISYEPILLASEVNASLRLSSLWRGQFEIARLHLKYPSLNLARSPNGEWNLESLLWQAARVETAPTTSPPERRPRFPYIDAEAGRINFKFGLEKSFFAFTEADFALWSPSENEWRMRLQGRPFRTDVNISDTGWVRAEGSFRRAQLLRDIPMQMRINWSGGQLGQITKIIYGRDRGWRGGAQFNALLEGTPADLRISASGSVHDFRRYDISRGEALGLDAKCSANFHSADRTFRDLNCQMPFQQGFLTVEGEVTGPQLRPYDLRIGLKDIPANAVTALLRHAKRALPDDLTAGGTINGSFSGRRGSNDAQGKWSGNGTGKSVVLRSATLGKDLEIGTLHFSAGPNSHAAAGATPAGARNRLVLDSFAIPLGGSAPVQASGWISLTGNSLRLQGEAEAARLLQAGRTAGLAVPGLKFSGAISRLDLSLRGDWAGFGMVRPSGRAQLRNGTVEIPGIANPVQLQSAQVEFADSQIIFRAIAGQIGKIGFSGEARVPRSCDDQERRSAANPEMIVASGDGCSSEFDLQADTVTLEDLNAQFNPFSNLPWYKVFGPGGGSKLGAARASGRITVRRLVLRQLTLSRLAGSFRLENGRLALNDVRADLLGGSQTGGWLADFTGQEPVYSGGGTVADLSVAQLAGVLHTPLGSGTVSANYQITLKGWGAGDLWNSATGTADFNWRNGSWRNIQLGRTAAQFSNFSGQLSLGDGKFEINPGKMQTAAGAYVVSGSISNGQLALELARGADPAYRLRGTLQKPVVEAAPAATGALRKP